MDKGCLNSGPLMTCTLFYFSIILYDAVLMLIQQYWKIQLAQGQIPFNEMPRSELTFRLHNSFEEKSRGFRKK